MGLIGLRLEIADYCDACREFEPKVVSYTDRKTGVMKYERIECAHRKKCDFAVSASRYLMNNSHKKQEE